MRPKLAVIKSSAEGNCWSFAIRHHAVVGHHFCIPCGWDDDATIRRRTRKTVFIRRIHFSSLPNFPSRNAFAGGRAKDNKKRRRRIRKEMAPIKSFATSLWRLFFAVYRSICLLRRRRCFFSTHMAQQQQGWATTNEMMMNIRKPLARLIPS